MLTAAGCQARRERLWNHLGSTSEVVLLTKPKELVYFGNYCPSPFVFRSQSAEALLILTRDGKAILCGDNLLTPFLEQAHVDEVVALDWYNGVQSALPRDEYFVRETATVLQSVLERYDWGELGPPNVLIYERAKDPDELELIRLSVKAGEAGLAAARREARPGMTEMDLYFLVQRAACEAIGMQAIVYGDFVAGPNTEKGGGPPSQRKIEQGDLVLIDFSTVVWHYRADFAATFVCGGKPTRQQRDMHQACLEAMSAGERLLRAGTPGRDIYHAVRGAFAARQMADFFPHHAGHGIGLTHPEAPFLVPKSTDSLIAGEVVTLEPGLYVPGAGGMRIERNYLITKDGYEMLSRHSLELEQ